MKGSATFAVVCKRSDEAQGPHMRVIPDLKLGQPDVVLQESQAQQRHQKGFRQFEQCFLNLYLPAFSQHCSKEKTLEA